MKSVCYDQELFGYGKSYRFCQPCLSFQSLSYKSITNSMPEKTILKKLYLNNHSTAYREKLENSNFIQRKSILQILWQRIPEMMIMQDMPKKSGSTYYLWPAESYNQARGKKVYPNTLKRSSPWARISFQKKPFLDCQLADKILKSTHCSRWQSIGFGKIFFGRGLGATSRGFREIRGQIAFSSGICLRIGWHWSSRLGWDVKVIQRLDCEAQRPPIDPVFKKTDRNWRKKDPDNYLLAKGPSRSVLLARNWIRDNAPLQAATVVIQQLRKDYVFPYQRWRDFWRVNGGNWCCRIQVKTFIAGVCITVWKRLSSTIRLSHLRCSRPPVSDKVRGRRTNYTASGFSYLMNDRPLWSFQGGFFFFFWEKQMQAYPEISKSIRRNISKDLQRRKNQTRKSLKSSWIWEKMNYRKFQVRSNKNKKKVGLSSGEYQIRPDSDPFPSSGQCRDKASAILQFSICFLTKD